MKTKIISLLFHSLFISNLVIAVESEGEIPTHANWVISLDMEMHSIHQEWESSLWKKLTKPNVKQKMDGLKNAFGVDLD